MEKDEMAKRISEVTDFLKDQKIISDLYDIKRLETKVKSKEILNDAEVEPVKLCALSIQYMVVKSAEMGIAAKSDDQFKRMQLIAAFLQGIFVSTELIFEGNYIKASATLKQDYEIMIRLNELVLGRAKYGKTPNPQNGPQELKNIYGTLNEIAHIVKDDILQALLHFTDKNKNEGISPVKKVDPKYLKELFLYDSLIKLEVLRHSLLLHQEIAGEDDIYKKGLANYNIIIHIFSVDSRFV